MPLKHHKYNTSFVLALLSASVFAFSSSTALSQDLPLPTETEEGDSSTPELQDLEDSFEFNSEGFDFEKTP